MAKGKKKKTALEKVIIALLILLILIVVAIGLLVLGSVFTGEGTSFGITKQDNVKRNVVVCDENADIPVYDDVTVNTSSNHDVKMNSTWTFSNGSSYSKDAYVENPSSNKNAVYFDITVPGVSGSVYTSPVLPVGSHIENIAFDKALSAGTYNGILTYSLLGADGETSIGTLQMAVKIIVKG